MHVTVYLTRKQNNSLRENSSVFVYFLIYLFSVVGIEVKLRAEPSEIRIAAEIRAFSPSPKVPTNTVAHFAS